MKSKMLGALALFTLIGALFVMQSAATSTPTADAATGSIVALNVGTCLTTDDSVFKGDCKKLSNDEAGTDDDWEVRSKIAEVATLYATYADDPKTASDDPRAILEDSDLLKISIADPGRDKRTAVLVGSAITINGGDGTRSDSGALAAILDLLAANSDVSIVDGSNKMDIILKRDMKLTEGDEVLGDSGNETLNFMGSKAASDPMDVKGNIRFFGCTVSNGTTCGVDGSDDGVDPDELQDITSSIEVDEDASSGANSESNIAPWLGVNASVPTGKDILIYAIYYETSKVENLVGGEKYHYCEDSAHEIYQDDDDAWQCDDPSTSDTKEKVKAKTRGVEHVDYASDEKSDNDALLVQAKSDSETGGDVNLFLTETSRFSGVYQGHLRLTDADGDGRTNGGTERKNWGLQIKDGATDNSELNAAVLDVESGPVTIEYRDTNGKKQTLRIEIDNRAPTITVSNPANGASSGDQSPDFSGNIEDADSGLADKSFRLVVDNLANNDKYVLEGKAPNADTVEGTGTGGTGKVTYPGEYSGFGDAPFGTVAASKLYNLGDDSCDNADHCYIESDEYADGANSGKFDDDVRLDLQNRKGSDSTDVDTRDKEFSIDFQAFVMDMAGNIGFSDSDTANPRFINALGEDKASDRGATGAKGKKHNVLGFYSAHVIMLDEKDPEIKDAESVTGFFGRADNKNIVDRYGVMVVFDGPIAAGSVSNSTFSVELDDGSHASVVDHKVDGKYVFLKLGSELASDATPKIDITQGQKVEDMAGNETFGREVDEFEVKDGISPRLTVTLSAGSGNGTGDEGPSKLTKDKITIHVSSDEALQNSPRIAVVCSSLRWNEGGKKNDASQVRENEVGSRHDIDDFVANRSGLFDSKPTDANVVTTIPRTSNTKTDSNAMYDYTCGYDSDDDNFGDDFDWGDAASQSRPGENWDYIWQNPSGSARMLRGDSDAPALTVVAFARDRSKHGADGNMENWGSASAEFTFDTELKVPTGDDLQPAEGEKVKETRPFVLIDFAAESTTVTLESVELDDVEIADQFEQPDHNRFLYWPLSLSQGEHEVEVIAKDAAGNDKSFDYSFTVEARGDFVAALNAGWNAISVPADPVDTAIGSVFTDPAITTVIGWDTQGWRIAMQRDGLWESNEKYGALNEIRARYGYWVKSDGFVRQPVKLKGGTSRDTGGTPLLISIPTEPGWNFVGVVDQDGNQTEDHFGHSLKGGDHVIPASEYLGSSYVRAYTWDATFSRFDVVRPDHDMTIGDGIWVYYPEGTSGIAP